VDYRDVSQAIADVPEQFHQFSPFDTSKLVKVPWHALGALDSSNTVRLRLALMFESGQKRRLSNLFDMSAVP